MASRKATTRRAAAAGNAVAWRHHAPAGKSDTPSAPETVATNDSGTPSSDNAAHRRRAQYPSPSPAPRPHQPPITIPTTHSEQTPPPTAPPATTPPVNPPQPPVTPPPAPTPTPPVTPPTPQPPTPTPTPPVPQPPTPQPPVNPPAPTPETDETKAKKLAESLKTTLNDNTAYFVTHDDQHRVALWTKGITAPRLGKNGQLRHEVFEVHGQRYAEDSLPLNDHTRTMGWYDADKSPNSTIADANLCFGAVAANQLHWWMAQNKQHVTQYLAKTNYDTTLPGNLAGGLKDLRIYQDSFKSQQDSQFFTMFKTYFGNNREGYHVDPLNDLFINGYKPKPAGGVNQEHWPPEFHKDDRGGFFYDVFGRKLLTDRLTTHQFAYFSNQIKHALQQAKSVGIIYTKSLGYTHVITAWGAEFDPNGTLTALYITDSDDQNDQKHNGLRRIGIKHIDGRAALSNNLTDPRHGTKIDSITTLGLGEAQWNAFLK